MLRIKQDRVTPNTRPGVSLPALYMDLSLPVHSIACDPNAAAYPQAQQIADFCELASSSSTCCHSTKSTSIQSQHGTHAEKRSAQAQDMIRARLLRGQTCSSAPEVGAGAELAPSMGDGASGDAFVTAGTCIAHFRCFLAFFFAALPICNIHSQFKKGRCVKCTAASDTLVGRCRNYCLSTTPNL